MQKEASDTRGFFFNVMSNKILYQTIKNYTQSEGLSGSLASKLTNEIEKLIRKHANPKMISNCKWINEDCFIIYFYKKNIEPLKATIKASWKKSTFID